jgi:hypothetical protein
MPPLLLRRPALRGGGEEEDDEGDAAEISRMGYCLGHRRLVAEAADMCEGCMSS